jgi:hypothetical protein
MNERRLGPWLAAASFAAALTGCTINPSSGPQPGIGVGAGGGDSASSSAQGQGGATSSASTGTGAGAGSTGSTSISAATGAAPTFAVGVGEAPSAELDDVVEVEVTIEANGAVGDVTLSALDLPSGVTAELDPQVLTLDGAETATATLRLSVASSAAAGASSFTVQGSSAAEVRTASGALQVEPILTVVIPEGVNDLGSGDTPFLTAYGPYPMPVAALPVTVRFYNADTIPHEIHADQGEIGFPHSPGPIEPGQMDSLERIITLPGTYDYYLHDQNSAATPGRIVVE